MFLDETDGGVRLGLRQGEGARPGWRCSRSQFRGKFRFMSIPPIPSSLIRPSPSSSAPSRITR